MGQNLGTCDALCWWNFQKSPSSGIGKKNISRKLFLRSLSCFLPPLWLMLESWEHSDHVPESHTAFWCWLTAFRGQPHSQWEQPLLHGFQTNLKQSFSSYGLIWSHFLSHTTELAEMIRIHLGVILWTGLCLSLVFCLCNCLHLTRNRGPHLSPSSSDTSVRITSLPSFSGRWQKHRKAIWVKPHEPKGKKGKLNISQTIIL